MIKTKHSVVVALLVCCCLNINAQEKAPPNVVFLLSDDQGWMDHGFTDAMTHGDPSRGGRHGDKGLDIGRKTMQPIVDFVAKAQRNEQPFFIWYGVFLPHSPHNAPERFYNKYKDIAPNKPTAKYWANIDWFDETRGQLVDHLKEQGLYENTLFVYTSDHGNMDASHRLASKSFPYEESVRVPFIMKYKGAIQSGQVDSEHLVSTGLDILPTLCDYAGVETPEHLVGKSLRPVAEGKPVANWRDYVVSEDGKWRMLRSGNYKYTTFSDPTSKESLVDLKKDPGEMRNLVDHPEYKEILRDHRKLLAEWSASTGDTEAFKFVRNDDGSSDYAPPPEQEKAHSKKAGKQKRKAKKEESKSGIRS